jgi:predicted RNase H-like HicB family nuclease
MRQYIALIHKDPDSDYSVSFPDLPGVISAGSTLDEARDMATEALAFDLEGMAEDDEAVPEPSTLEEIMAIAENRDGVAVLLFGIGCQRQERARQYHAACRRAQRDRSMCGAQRLHPIGVFCSSSQEGDGRLKAGDRLERRGVAKTGTTAPAFGHSQAPSGLSTGAPLFG